MDTHTLELLEFDKIRTLVAARAACSLGKEGARRLEPSRDLGEIRQRQALTTEMADALSAGLTPPFGGLHDIRPNVRRAQGGAMLEADGLAPTGGAAPALGGLGRLVERIGEGVPPPGGVEGRRGG